MSSIFTRIINREIPATIVYEDDQVIAFKDINPAAPIHILIVPKKEIPSINEVMPEDEAVMGHLFIVAKQIASEQGIAENGYRLIVNTGEHGGQEVPHIHLHLMGGRKLGPMLARS